MDAAGKYALRVVGGLDIFEVDGEVGTLGQVVDINGVDIVAAGRTALGRVEDGLIEIGLGREVQGLGAGVDDTSGGDANVGINVDAAVEVGGQKGNVKITLGDDFASFGVHLVEVVLSSGPVDVLRGAIVGSVNERLRKDLLGGTAIFAWQHNFEDLAKLIAADDGGVHVVITGDLESVECAIVCDAGGKSENGIDGTIDI